MTHKIISGPLSLLAIAKRNDIIVDGHNEAIHTICAWLDQWQNTTSPAYWPEVISRDELDHGASCASGPHRPSWCYGTPGIARAQHLAGLATADYQRVHLAVQALIGCLTDIRQLVRLTGRGICHGRAGLIHTARRAYADTPDPGLAAAIESATFNLQNLDSVPSTTDGLLDGTAGIMLTSNLSHGRPADTMWDTCLLTA